MLISVITPNFNGAAHLADCIESVASQSGPGIEVEHLLIDGGSRDESLAIAERYRASLATLVSEPDNGPACAINKGLRMAKGDLVAWLNADDYYTPGALARVADAALRRPRQALYFGRCDMVDGRGQEIRQAITRFKELFFPFSCRFVIQCINYISQPAMFFRRAALARVGLLREDMLAAWDYEFILRLWRAGGAARVPGAPLAAFRRHERSISEQHYRRQFAEELEVAIADAGRWSIQAALHRGVRWGIVEIYAGMKVERTERGATRK